MLQVHRGGNVSNIYIKMRDLSDEAAEIRRPFENGKNTLKRLLTCESGRGASLLASAAVQSSRPRKLGGRGERGVTESARLPRPPPTHSSLYFKVFSPTHTLLQPPLRCLLQTTKSAFRTHTSATNFFLCRA